MKSKVTRKRPDWAKKHAAITRRALNRATNRTAASMRSKIAREVSKEMGLRAKDVRAATSLERGRVSRPGATIEARGRPLNLVRFRARQTKRGVRARPWGKPRVYSGTWIGNNGRTVFIRTSRKRARSRAAGVRGSSITKHNQAIRPVWGPGVARSVAESTRTAQFRKAVKDRFDREFRESYAFQVERAGLKRER